MAEFMVDIRGRINNTPLPDYKNLWALFEAVVNSIQSIEEANIPNGYIEVYAERQGWEQIALNFKEAHISGEDYKPEITPFVSFSVTDNGDGFTAENYKSFLTADSSLKWKKGCKGIGRFLWLKAFNKTRVESTYSEAGKWLKRTFEFTFTGITPDDNIAVSDIEERKTTVFLNGIKPPYSKKIPKSLDVIADLTDSMRDAALGSGLIPTPDNEGYFGYNQGYGACIEVISYDKLLRDAKERNQVLFDKLFMPSPNAIINRIGGDKKSEGDDTAYTEGA